MRTELDKPMRGLFELFEWLDGNPNNEDRAGYFVKLVGDKITIADEFDTPLGVFQPCRRLSATAERCIGMEVFNR